MIHGNTEKHHTRREVLLQILWMMSLENQQLKIYEKENEIKINNKIKEATDNGELKFTLESTFFQRFGRGLSIIAPAVIGFLITYFLVNKFIPLPEEMIYSRAKRGCLALAALLITAGAMTIIQCERLPAILASDIQKYLSRENIKTKIIEWLAEEN